MWISCWNCGQDVWLETQKQCRHCDAVIHRCADCANYEAEGPRCLALNIDLDPDEALKPTRLALSVNCSAYQISEEAIRLHPAAGAGAPAAAPVVPVGQAASPARREALSQTLSAAEGSPSKGAGEAARATDSREAAPPPDEQFITIRREPPLKRPKLPLVIAHRGDSSAAPENTLSALKSAVAAGAHGVEFDVHLTSDDHAVVIHDATVERCSNGTGAVVEMTLAQIKALDAGAWFAEPFEGEQIPTLDEAIEALPAPTVLFIHLRAHENETDRCERRIAEAAERHKIHRRGVIVHHTRHGLQRLREMDPKLRLCWIPYGGQPGEEYVDDAYYLGCRFMQPLAKELDEHFVKYAHDKGMWVNAFWADEIEEMERTIRLGVDGIITNYPRRLREVLKDFA